MINTNKIRGRIVELGMNQGDIANRLGMAQPTFSQKINNIRPMDLEEAEKISEILEIPKESFCEYFFS